MIGEARQPPPPSFGWSPSPRFAEEDLRDPMEPDERRVDQRSKMEPRASAPARRLAAIAELSQAGVPVGVLAAPMIPGLNDAEMEAILRASSAAGAAYAGYVLLRLPHELRDMFGAWLTQHVPDRARRVLGLIRQTRTGALNDSSWHDRFVGTGPYADLLARRFEKMSRELGFGTRHVPLDRAQFRVPGRAEQLSLI